MLRPFRLSLVLAIVALALAACSPADKTYFREGIGSDLYAGDAAAETALQNVYIQNICAQAGIAGGAACIPDAFDPRAWTVFVQAGMNDLDRRCDAYLVWLDARRRVREPVLQELSDVRTATTAIMAATGVGVEPIAIAAAAFGLATASFTNLNSSLVFALDQSTLQSVVLSNQTQFRETLPLVIDNRPAAIFALRSYMRLCMPMTIETEVNTTVRLFQQGRRLNMQALEIAKENPLVNAKTVQTAVLRDVTAMPRPIVIPAPVIPPDEPRIGVFETRLRPPQIERLQSAACMTADGHFTPLVRQKMIDFLTARGLRESDAPPDHLVPRDAAKLKHLENLGPHCPT